MNPCSIDCISQPHPFPWVGMLVYVVCGVTGIYIIWWMKWLWKFRKPLYRECALHCMPLVDAKHYYGPVWWKEVFSLNYDSGVYGPYWITELYQHYPCARYGTDEGEQSSGLAPVMERHCSLCTKELEARVAMRWQEERREVSRTSATEELASDVS